MGVRGKKKGFEGRGRIEGFRGKMEREMEDEEE